MDELTPGAAVDVSARVRRVLAPNPGLMTGPGTNTYLVGRDEVAVIDPGPADDGHLDTVAIAGAGAIRWIVVTHTHPDHAPGAAGLRERTGAEVLGFAARDGFEPDRRLTDGDRVEGPGFTLTAVHTPGHASNHLCYLLDEERLLFSGDHVMQGSTVVIRPPDGDMTEYLASLERLLRLRLDAIAPGHGRVIGDPDGAVRDYLAHRRAREAAIVDALGAGADTVDDIVARVYVDVREELHPVARHSVHAHLRKLAAEGRTAGDGIDGRWRMNPPIQVGVDKSDGEVLG